MTDKIYESELYVPYENKDKAKEYSLFFNNELKTWFIRSNNEHYDEMCNLYTKTYLKNIYKNKEIYKLNVARWSPTYNKWFTYASNVKLQEYFE